MSDYLYRAAPFEADGRNLLGVAVPFGRTALVNDGRGVYREGFNRAAFNKALKERAGKAYPLLMMHPSAPGARTSPVPLGPVHFAAGRDGLEFDARLSKTRDADEALELYHDGILTDVSIGFRAFRSRQSQDQDGPFTERMEATPFELSLAVNGTGVYPGAEVTAVRTRLDTPYRDELQELLATMLRP